MTNVGFPEYFCWSKIGDEGGERLADIIARKEQDRRANDGIFLWGIGASVAAGITALLDKVETPKVLFTDILGSGREKDRNPSATYLWRSAVGALHGESYEMPTHSIVTSVDRARRSALVRRSDAPLNEQRLGLSFQKAELRNVPSGKVPADQQSTIAVQYRRSSSATGGLYRVRFQAELIEPYLVQLGDRVEVPSRLRRALQERDPAALEELRNMK